MAHEQAQQYQREMHERTQNNDSNVINQADVSAINRLFNRGGDNNNNALNTHASNASFASGIDYTSSRFHNTLLGRNDTTMVVSEAIRAQNEKNAPCQKTGVLNRGSAYFGYEHYCSWDLEKEN